MTPSAHNPTSQPVDPQPFGGAERRVEEDLPCLACGYNLRGLVVEERCSECGSPVLWSVRGGIAGVGNVRWLTTVRRGIEALTLCAPLLWLPIVWPVAWWAAWQASAPDPRDPHDAALRRTLWSRALCVGGPVIFATNVAPAVLAYSIRQGVRIALNPLQISLLLLLVVGLVHLIAALLVARKPRLATPSRLSAVLHWTSHASSVVAAVLALLALHAAIVLVATRATLLLALAGGAFAIPAVAAGSLWLWRVRANVDAVESQSRAAHGPRTVWRRSEPGAGFLAAGELSKLRVA